MKSRSNKAIQKNHSAFLKIIRFAVVGLFALEIFVISACSGGENNTNTNISINASTNISTDTSKVQLKRSDIEECRVMAPEDPYVDDAEDSEAIYSSCEKAAVLLPDDSEIAYLLGTSALETGRTEEALLAFQKADDLGSCKALYFLGDHAWHFEKNAEVAEDYYTRGAECGDERAAWEVYSPGVFENSAEPELVEALYNSDISKLNRVRFISASYVYGFYKELGEQYLGEKFDTCWKKTHFRGGEILNQLLAAEKGDASNILESGAYEYALPYVFQLVYPGQGSKSMEERRESQREAGKADLLRLVESSKCDSIVPYKFVKGVELFAKTRKPLYETVREIAPEAKSLSDIPEILRNRGRKNE